LSSKKKLSLLISAFLSISFNIDAPCHIGYCVNKPSFLPLRATAPGELWPPERSASILLYSSFFLPTLSLSFSFADFDFHSVHPSEADYLVSERLSFYGVRYLASRPTPNLEDQGVPLRLATTP
jgi:hypothetical protein